MTPKRQRMWIVIASVIMVAIGATLILRNFSEHMIYFYTPTELKSAQVVNGQTIRLGGLVERGSVESTGDQSIRFVVTDMTNSVSVTYTGTLPSLFREGQGVIAQGTLDSAGILSAKTILAKHDEYYLPKDVVDELKKSGRWEQYQQNGEMPK